MMILPGVHLGLPLDGWDGGVLDPRVSSQPHWLTSPPPEKADVLYLYPFLLNPQPGWSCRGSPFSYISTSSGVEAGFSVDVSTGIASAVVSLGCLLTIGC